MDCRFNPYDNILFSSLIFIAMKMHDVCLKIHACCHTQEFFVLKSISELVSSSVTQAGL